MTKHLLKFALLGLALLVPNMNAGVIDLSIINPDRIANPGDVLIFTGTFNNQTGGTLDEFSTSINFGGAWDSSVLDIVELLSSQSFTVADGNVSPLLNLFQVTVAVDAPNAIHFADAYLQADPFVGDSSTISIDTTAPEPGSIVLMTLGAGLIGLFKRRK